VSRVLSGSGRFRGGGGKQIQLMTEGRENGDLGAVAPESGVPLNLQMNETHILIRLLRMYIPRNWEFGSALAKLPNFGGGGELNPQTTLGTPLSEGVGKGSSATVTDRSSLCLFASAPQTNPTRHFLNVTALPHRYGGFGGSGGLLRAH
jgi:hypothetical protein